MALFAKDQRKEMLALSETIAFLEAKEQATEGRYLNEIAQMRKAHALEISERERVDAGRQLEIAKLEGRLDEAHSRSQRYDVVMGYHNYHIGGKKDVHGHGVLIQWDCACGATVFVPEDFF